MILDWDYICYREQQNIVASILLATPEDQAMMIEQLTEDYFTASGPKLVFHYIRNLHRAHFRVNARNVAKASSFHVGHLKEWCSRIRNYRFVYSTAIVDLWDPEMHDESEEE